jgi:hypothetical protein
MKVTYNGSPEKHASHARSWASDFGCHNHDIIHANIMSIPVRLGGLNFDRRNQNGQETSMQAYMLLV